MKFSYEFYRDAYFPVVPLVLHGNKQVKTFALVDSGARISVFSNTICKLLGLEMRTGEESTFQGVSAKLVGYIHTIQMILAGREITCRVAFSEELSTSFNILGRMDIFDKFHVCFDEAERTVEFIPKG